jgi:hypothetical protein
METNYPEVYNAYNLFLAMHRNFSYATCQQLWNNNPDHYWNLWNDSGHNIVLFLERYPDIRSLVLNWGTSLL